VALPIVAVVIYLFVWRREVLGTFYPARPRGGGRAATQIASAVANWPAKIAWVFVPLHSSTSDVIRIVDEIANARLGLGIAVALGSAIGFGWCLRRGHPLAAIGLAWIWMAYAPTAGLVPQLHGNGERYWFLSAFGAALVIADLLTALSHRLGRNASVAAAALLILFLGQRTTARIPDWESNLGLFQHDIAADPAFREGYFLVARELFQRGRFNEADATLAPLLRDDPVFAGTAGYANPLSVAELACSLAFVQKRYESIVALEQTLARTQPSALRAAPVRACIGQGYNALGETRRALELFRGVADELGADAPPALPLMIARAHFRLDEFDAARQWLERARSAAGSDAVLQQKIRALNDRLPPPAGASDSAGAR
jgi:tetratricopeptide (TPR) repeat protein